jgi:hypothetical protein
VATKRRKSDGASRRPVLDDGGSLVISKAPKITQVVANTTGLQFLSAYRKPLINIYLFFSVPKEQELRLSASINSVFEDQSLIFQ